MLLYFYISNIILISFPKIIFSFQSCYEYSCAECSSSEYGTCTQCRETFRLLDGKCLCSFSSCSLCTTGLGGLRICHICREGYIHHNNECYCPINNCEICALNSCQKCIDGYYYNSSLNECLEQNPEDKIKCFDSNCYACFSEEKGACKFCKEGYYERKGECISMDLAINNTCDDNHYLVGNYCKEKCMGVTCNVRVYTLENGWVYLCPENHCLICVKNEIKFITECDNSKECSSLEGCLNCVDDQECLICLQGYYNIGGICKKCIEGCSVCVNQLTCEYCLSGYELTEDKKCTFTKNFDYNETDYKEIKDDLITENFPEEIVNQSTIVTTPITTIVTTLPTTIIRTTIIAPKPPTPITIECDTNCMRCNTKTGLCYYCKSSYNLVNNRCIKQTNPTTKPKTTVLNTITIINKETNKETQQIIKITDFPYVEQTIKISCEIENCLKCSISNNKQICSQCNFNYYLENNSCKKNCEVKNCDSCSIDGKTCNKCNKDSKLYEGKCAIKCTKKHKNCVYCLNEKCIECEQGYKLKNNFCRKNKNKFDTSFLYLLILLLVIAMTIIITHKYHYNKIIKNKHIKLDEQ